MSSLLASSSSLLLFFVKMSCFLSSSLTCLNGEREASRASFWFNKSAPSSCALLESPTLSSVRARERSCESERAQGVTSSPFLPSFSTLPEPFLCVCHLLLLYWEREEGFRSRNVDVRNAVSSFHTHSRRYDRWESVWDGDRVCSFIDNPNSEKGVSEQRSIVNATSGGPIASNSEAESA